MAYQLEGKLLEVCDCNVLCPCWIGENPDNGTCNTVVAYHIDKGVIEGTDVSGLTLALAAFIPENVLKGDWRVVVFVDDKATPQQQEALLNVWTGKLGVPVADLTNDTDAQRSSCPRPVSCQKAAVISNSYRDVS
jgi:hypothetical protein